MGWSWYGWTSRVSKKKKKKKSSWLRIQKKNWHVNFFFSANDVLDPKDPDAPESNRFNADEAAEENFKTLDQYLKEKKDVHVPTLQPRKPNEGSDDSQWKDAVALQKEEDNYFIGKVYNQ